MGIFDRPPLISLHLQDSICVFGNRIGGSQRPLIAVSLCLVFSCLSVLLSMSQKRGKDHKARPSTSRARDPAPVPHRHHRNRDLPIDYDSEDESVPAESTSRRDSPSSPSYSDSEAVVITQRGTRSKPTRRGPRDHSTHHGQDVLTHMATNRIFELLQQILTRQQSLETRVAEIGTQVANIAAALPPVRAGHTSTRVQVARRMHDEGPIM